MRTRAEQKAATRARLLEAAAVLVASKGVEGASVDAIAAAAGVTTGALYASFRTKAELLAALVAERNEDVSEVPLEELADSFGERWTRLLDADPVGERALLELLVAAGRDPGMQDLMAARVGQSVEALAQRLETEGLPLRLPPHDTAVLLQVLAAGSVVLRPVLGEQLPSHVLTAAVDLMRDER